MTKLSPPSFANFAKNSAFSAISLKIALGATPACLINSAVVLVCCNNASLLKSDIDSCIDIILANSYAVAPVDNCALAKFNTNELVA